MQRMHSIGYVIIHRNGRNTSQTQSWWSLILLEKHSHFANSVKLSNCSLHIINARNLNFTYNLCCFKQHNLLRDHMLYVLNIPGFITPTARDILVSREGPTKTQWHNKYMIVLIILGRKLRLRAAPW